MRSPVPEFKHGGVMPRTWLAFLHRGERGRPTTQARQQAEPEEGGGEPEAHRLPV